MFDFHDVLIALSLVAGSLILVGLIIQSRVSIKVPELIDEDKRSGGYNPRDPLNVSVKPPPHPLNDDDFKIFEDYPALLNILQFSKQSKWTRFDGRNELKNQLSRVLEPHYSVELKEMNIHRVLYRYWWLVINDSRFKTGYTVEEKVQKLLVSAFEAKWGARGLVYPNEAPNDIEDVLYLQIEHMLITFQLTSIGWCREVLYPEEKQMQAKSSG